MRVLGIVPARGGSKRVPRKNVRPLGGKPLVAWAIEAGLGAETVDRVVVSSDDDEVLEIAAEYGKGVPLRRPNALARDVSPAIEYLRHALEVMDVEGETFDAVAILQPSSPLTTSADVDATLRLLQSSGADSAVTVVELDHAIHPAKLKTLEGDRLHPYLMDEGDPKAAHELPALFVRNGAVYASRRTVIEAGRVLGDDCRAHVMPADRSVDINEERDLTYAQFLFDTT